MGIRVLGAIEVGTDEAIAIGGPRQRRLFAALALRIGEVVSLDKLIDVIWEGDEPPDAASHNVHTYVARIRRALGPSGLSECLRTVAPGYVLEVETDQLDSDLFERLAARARRLLEGRDSTAAVQVADDALALWRGRPYAEFADENWCRVEVLRLEEIHTALVETRSHALVETGRHTEALADLHRLIAEHPLREAPRRLVMIALLRSGRQVESLRAFQDFRTELSQSVGVEPSTELIELDRAIAANDPSLFVIDEAISARAYEIHEQIGEGASAIVYRGTQTGLDRDVAIKAIKAELANRPEFIRRFETEAHLVARLEHPHIVPLYDYWREPDRAYLVMRWLPGGTLEQSLDGGPWSVERTARMVEQVGTALAAAHRAGVVHRDVKPANIILDNEGNSFLGDFGIALRAQDSPSADSAVLQGSAAYASPEQLRRERVGPPADIHGLAITAYEALTGRPPFGDSPDPAITLQRQLNDAIPSLREVRPEFPGALDDILQRATNKDPTARHQDIRDFVEEFRSAAAAPDPGAVAIPVHQLAVVSISNENPYKGLRPFDEGDADDFFGRDRLVDELVEAMNSPRPDARLMVLVGPSGSGKSSVVKAGLLPAIRRGAVPGSDQWFITTMNPGAHPFEQLETALLRVAVNPPAALLDQLSDGPRGIIRGVRRTLPDDSTQLLVVIDQFEELFTLCESESIRTRFLAGLAAAVSDPRSPVRVLMTLRADFYDRPLQYPDFAALIKQNSVTVTPLAGSELEQAISGPAARAGAEFEAGLVAQIVADVTSQPGALPLLQYALTELFDTHVSGLLLLNRYRELGGLNGALARRADELHESASPQEQAAIRRLFGRMVTLGEGSEDTRRRVAVSEVGTDRQTKNVIDLYGAARLLTFDRAPRTREPTVEVAHEALIREWPRLEGWLGDDRDQLRVHRHLTTSASGWDDRGRDDGDLYRGLRLEATEAWSEASDPLLNEVESEFLEASSARKAADHLTERNRMRRLRRLLVTTAAIAVLALIAGAFALREQRRADDQAALAAQNADLAIANEAQASANATRATESATAASANAELASRRAVEAEAAQTEGDLERLRAVALARAPGFPIVAALLAVEAHRIDPSVESLDAMHRVLTAVPGLRGALQGGPYSAAALLKDGTTLAAVSTDRIDVWDIAEGKLIRSIAHSSDSGTASLDLTGDGRVVAVRGEPDETRLYDLTTGQSLGSIRHDAPINDVSLTRDGTRLAAARVDGQIEIWDLTTRSPETTLDTGTANVRFARWSPTEDRLAVVTSTSEVQFWDPSRTESLWTVAPLSAAAAILSRPNSVLFDSDGQRFVVDVGSFGAQLRVFDVDDGNEPFDPTPRPSTGAEVPLDGLYWVDEEASIIAAQSAGSVRAFDLSTGERGDVVIDRRQAIDIVFSQKLDRIITVSAGGLGIWSIDGSGPLERVIPLPAAQRESLAAAGGNVHTSLAADGSQLLTSVISFPGAPAALFDLTSDPATSKEFTTDVFQQTSTTGYGRYTLLVAFAGAQLLGPSNVALGPPVPFPFDLSDIAASPDGRFFALARLGGFVDLYSGSGELVANLEMGQLAPFEGAIIGPSFTDDGELVAATTSEGTVAVWSTDTLERLDLRAADDWEWARLAGDWLMVRLSDASLLRLDPRTSEPIGEPLVNIPGGYYSWDQTHSRMAVGAGPVKVLDLATGKQLGRDLPNRPYNFEFTADGKVLSVPGDDRVTLWNYDTDTWAEIACRFAGRNLTADEWNQLGPRTIERRATCPQFPLS